ncbi:MAG TPA: AMP-binding protein [bacterium]|nr:AMP-binding protein [bacterium]HPN32149.1 AMP-binding protein [bacterium]
MNNNILGVIQNNSNNFHSKTAFTFLNADDTSQTINYFELDLKARLISALLKNRISNNKSILILIKPGINFILAFLGCLYSKIISAPTYLPYNIKGFERPNLIIKNLKTEYILTEKSYYEKKKF